MNIDGDYETGNDDIVQQMNNQYSVHNVEKNLEMEMKREEDTITGKCKNNNINQNKEHEMMEMENPLSDHNMISLTSQENKDIDQVNMKQNYNIQFDESETNKKKKFKVKMQRYNHEDIIITGCKETIQENSVSSINLPKNTQAKITEKKLVIFELKDVFYQSINDDSTKKEHIEKMGRVEDETIEKRLFWFHPHAIHFFNMCFQNESLDIAIWTTTSKEIATKVIENLVSKTSRDRLVFTWNASNCKSQKMHKDIDNRTTTIHTKSLRKVWDTHTQYDESNTIIVDCSLETVKENPKENVLLATPFIGKDEKEKWLINNLWRILNKFNKTTDVRATLKDFE